MKIDAKNPTCGLCGHAMKFESCGGGFSDGEHLCHHESHDCYHRWTLYRERPADYSRSPIYAWHEPLNDSNGGASFDLCEVDNFGKPSCKEHGAMNKVSSSDNGGLWRCLQGKCRAGCKEKS